MVYSFLFLKMRTDMNSFNNEHYYVSASELLDVLKEYQKNYGDDLKLKFLHCNQDAKEAIEILQMVRVKTFNFLDEREEYICFQGYTDKTQKILSLPEIISKLEKLTNDEIKCYFEESEYSTREGIVNIEFWLDPYAENLASEKEPSIFLFAYAKK